MSRPAIIIDMAKLAALMRMKPTLADAAAFFECSEDTIERRIRDEYNLSFAEFREQKMVHTRMSLVRKAISKAEQGDNVMLIFCLKNLCDWRDKQQGDDPSVVINLADSVGQNEDAKRLLELMNKAHDEIREKDVTPKGEIK